MEQKRKLILPHIGQRIIRSAVGVFLCYAVYLLRSRLAPENAGIPFYSMLAVLWCIQPYTGKTLVNAFQRTVGTLIGAVFGLVAILLEIYAFDIYETVWGYLLTAFMIIPVIYTTVAIHKQNASYFSCVVFLSITVNHIADANPFIFVGNRVLDTFIGVVVGVFLNAVHLPRKKRRDILFIAELDDMLSPLTEGSLSAYSKVEINRMLDDGLMLSFATMRTPASLMKPLKDIHIKLPVIVMDGAALYDINENEYLRAYFISNETVSEIRKILSQNDMRCFINALCGGVLVIYYDELKNPAEKSIYSDLHKSPYRNYIKREPEDCDRVIYLMIIDETAKILKLRERLSGYDERLKILCYPSHDYEGFSYIKIYNKNASRENMAAFLRETAKAEKTVSVGAHSGDDIRSDDMNGIVRTIKGSFEPLVFSNKQH